MSRMTGSTIHPPRRRRAGWSPAWATARTAAWHALGWPGRVYRARQLMHQLGGLADHELRDIGLTRTDLHAASALPPDADPSCLLQRRAEETRRRR